MAVADKDPPESFRNIIGVDFIFFLLFAFAEIATIAAAYVGGADYDDDADTLYMNGTVNRIADYYTFYIPIALFVLVGFGLLYTFLRKYAYSSLGFGLLIWCWAFQWTIVTRIFWDNVYDVDNSDSTWQRGYLTIWQMINGMYGATACLITFGALLGRVRPVVLMSIVWMATMFYNLNYYLVCDLVPTVDFAGPLTIHVFGALFGICCSLGLSPLAFWGEPEQKNWNVDRISNYNSNTFSMIGMLVMVATYPAFNAALASDGAQFRVVINTILSVVASVVSAMVSSKFFWGKISPLDAQLATTAGGVAIAAATAEVVNPAGALIIGGVVGFLTIVSYAFLTPMLEQVPKLRKTLIVDPAGVLSGHFVPGFLGAVAGIVGVAIITGQDSDVYGVSPIQATFPKGERQAGHQTAGLFISIGVAMGGGLLTGLIMLLLNLGMNLREAWKQKIWYSDQEYWNVPSDFEIVTLETSSDDVVNPTDGTT